MSFFLCTCDFSWFQILCETLICSVNLLMNHDFLAFKHTPLTVFSHIKKKQLSVAIACYFKFSPSKAKSQEALATFLRWKILAILPVGVPKKAEFTVDCKLSHLSPSNTDMVSTVFTVLESHSEKQTYFFLRCAVHIICAHPLCFFASQTLFLKPLP